MVAMVAAVLAAAAGAATASPVTYYVRTDGGSPEQCTGLADAPYPGGGAGLPCALDHPFRLLPPGGIARLAPGDTLFIGSGGYMIGLGAPGADACSSFYPWDCVMPPIPSGADAERPTVILGAGWESGCPQPPVLWGTERAAHILDLTGSHDLEIACLELTDRSPCVSFHTGGLACRRDPYPFGPWAEVGIRAADSARVTLRHLDIHGLASAGVHAGRLADWTLEDVRIAANGWAGWDGDVAGDDWNSGHMVFRRVAVEWNGCGESVSEGEPMGCWGQTAGGYGDGLGTGETGGDWLFEECEFSHNTSDGLDLIYLRPPSSVTIRRSRFERNAGNQVKTSGPTFIENSVVVAECTHFSNKPLTHHVDECRAAGVAVSVSLWSGQQATLRNSTITGEGDCLVVAGCWSACTGREQVRLRNNLFIGREKWTGGDQACLLYQEGFPHGSGVWDADYSLIWEVRHDACPGPNDVCGQIPGVRDPALASFDGRLAADSPAVDRGLAAESPRIDVDGFRRDARPDIGAHEFRPAPRPPRLVIRPAR